MFGKIQEKISTVKGNIDFIQNASISEASVVKERELQSELDLLLQKEEVLWMEKSKEKWLEEGD